MKNRETEDGFLDELYAQTSNEVPPEFLDQAIIKQAHAKVSKRDVASHIHWQRYLSVAAVMILSIYIFLDVGEFSRDSELYSPSENRAGSAAPVEDGMMKSDHQAQRLKEMVSKSKKMFSPALVEVASDSEALSARSFGQNTDSATSDSLNLLEEPVIEMSNIDHVEPEKGSEKADFAKPRNIPAKSLSQLSIEGYEAQSLAPEIMISKIEELIAEGDLTGAKVYYKSLTELHPDYSVPKEIIKTLK